MWFSPNFKRLAAKKKILENEAPENIDHVVHHFLITSLQREQLDNLCSS